MKCKFDKKVHRIIDGMFCFMTLSAFFSLKIGIKFKSRGWLVGIIVFNATFNNISAISWW